MERVKRHSHFKCFHWQHNTVWCAACCQQAAGLAGMVYNVNIKICATITLPAVLDGCEIKGKRDWGHLRTRLWGQAKMFGPDTEKATRMWRKFCNELHDLCASLIIITMENEMGEGHKACMGEKRILMSGRKTWRREKLW